jgi:hypothetical protein
VTPSELDLYLSVARKHGATHLRIGDGENGVEVTLSPVLAAAAAGVGQLAQEPPPPKTPEEHWDRIDQALHGGLST